VASSIDSKKRLFSLNTVFVGREREIESIYVEYDKLLKGGMGIAAVVGPPGMGKTYLVEHALGQLTGNTYLYGKSTQNEKWGLTSIAGIIDQIVRHCLTLPRQTLISLTRDLQKRLGGDMALLSYLSPILARAFHVKAGTSEQDFDKRLYRVKNAVYKLIDSVSTYLFPLVIYIDDLQWANQLTLDIVKTLVNKKGALNILLMVSYRDTETHRNMRELIALLKESCYMPLAPLTYDQIEAYIGSAFGSVVNQGDLTRLVHGLTSGNPFYVMENIKVLHEDGIVSYTESKQAWDVQINGIHDYFLRDDMKGMLEQKIRKARDHNGDLLELIACLDGDVSCNILKAAARMDDAVLDAGIKALLASAILVSHQDKKQKRLLFSHDIVYKLADNTLTPERKEYLHYDIAAAIMADEGIGMDNRDQFIVSHLLRASAQIVRKEAQRWIDILYRTGNHEMQMASTENALAIFLLCREILPGCAIGRAMYVNLHLQLAECLCLAHRDDEYRAIMDMLTDTCTDAESAVAIKRKQILFHHYRREHTQVLRQGAQLLKLLHFRYGLVWMPVDLIHGLLVYTTDKIRKLADPEASAPDETVLTISDTLTIMNSSAALTNEAMSTACIGLSAALVSAKYGESANPLLGFVSYDYVLYMVWKDRRKAVLMLDSILALLEKRQDHSSKPFTFFIIGAFLAHWSKSVEETDQYLQEAIKYGEITGDFFFLGYSITTSLDTKSYLGKSLDQRLGYIDDCRQRFLEIEQYTNRYNYEAHREHILSLKNGPDDLAYDRIGGKYPKLTSFETLTEEHLCLERCFLLGKYELGYALLKITTPKIKSANGLLCKIILLINSVLIRIAAHHDLPKRERRHNLRHIQAHLKELAYWAKVRPENYEAYRTLIEAEYEIHINGKSGAGELYNHCIEAAVRQGNLKVAALANLRAARHYQAIGNLSSYYAAQAARLYKQWGADHIGDQVAREYGLSLEEGGSPSEEPAAAYATTSTEITHFVREIEHMDEDQTTERLLTSVIGHGHAQYCGIIYEKTDELFLRHEIDTEAVVKSYRDMIDINHVPHIAHRLIRYVGRTGQEAYLSPSEDNSLFARDAHIMSAPDLHIACIPMMYHGVFIGLIYLEKHGTPISEDTIWFLKGAIPAFIANHTEIKGVHFQKLLNTGEIDSNLTDREIEIIKLVAAGLSNAQISDTLNITLGTTKKHLSNIMTKLEVDNRVKVILRAQELNLVQ